MVMLLYKDDTFGRILIVDDLGRLQRGQTVTLDDGRVIEPSQVMNPSIPGHVCILFINNEHT